jgi:SHO1 osmosensor
MDTFQAGVVYADALQIVGFLAAGLVFCSSIINALVYSPEGPKEAAAAGFILLSMVSVRGPRHRWKERG